jgi:hypothetical protein
VLNAEEDYNFSTLSPKENGSNNNYLPVLVNNAAEDQLIVPRAGRSWRTSAVDGSVKMFSFVASTSDAVYASVCGISTLAALGLVGPAGAFASMTACAVSLGLLAVVNWASYIVSSHNDHGGWNWDPSTGTAKRELDGNHNILLSLGAERYRHIADDIYTLDLDVDDGAFNGLNLNKRDSNGKIIHKGKVVRVNNGLVSDLGYQMIVDENGHNKSMFAEPDAIAQAVKTYITCGHEQECYEDGVL